MERPDMTERTMTRDRLIKLLYLSEFHDSSELGVQYEEYFSLFDPIPEEERDRILGRLLEIKDKLGEIDALLSKLMTGWKLDRLGKVELSILRLAVFEIVFDSEIPNKAAVNEAVELTKIYAGSKAAGFVNGILAKFMKDDSEK